MFPEPPSTVMLGPIVSVVPLLTAATALCVSVLAKTTVPLPPRVWVPTNRSASYVLAPPRVTVPLSVSGRWSR